MKDTCQEIREYIAPALLDDLPATGLEAVRRHIAACPACAEEQRKWQATFSQMESLREIEPPQHFTINPAAAPPALRPQKAGFRLETWRWPLAACLTGLMILGGAASGLIWWRLDQSGFSFGVGRPPAAAPAPVPDPARELATFRTEFLAALDRRLQEHDRQWQDNLRQELAAFGQTWSARQQQQLNSRLTSMENNVSQRLQDARTVQRSDSEMQLTAFYDLLRSERKQDLQYLTQRIGQLANRNEYRATQTDVILATLLEAAESQMKRLD